MIRCRASVLSKGTSTPTFNAGLLRGYLPHSERPLQRAVFVLLYAKIQRRVHGNGHKEHVAEDEGKEEDKDEDEDEDANW